MGERAKSSATAFWGDADETEALQRYRTLVNTIDDGVYQLDAEGHFVAVNDGIVEITGYAREELLGEHVSVLLNDDSSAVEREIERLRTNRTERSELLEFTVQAAEGKQVRCEVRMNLLEADGTVQGIVGIARDVTERKRTKRERLREVQNQLEIATGAGSVGIWTWDIQENVLTADEFLAESYGMTPEEATAGAPIEEFFEPVYEEDRERVWQQLDEAVEETGEFEAEYRIRDADDNTMWVMSRAEVEYDENGEPLRMNGAISEITEQKQRERRAELLKKLNQALQPLTDPDEIMATAARLLGEHLDADRCTYAEVESDENRFRITGDYTRGDTASIEGEWAMSAFGEAALRSMRGNEPYIVDDVDADECVTAADRKAYDQTGIRATVFVPLHKGGSFTAGMAVHQQTPREWQSHEVDLVTTVAQRCWESLERARTMRELHEREQHLSALVETTPECIKNVAADGTLLQMNPAGLDMVEADSASSVIGECIYDLIAPEHRQRFRTFNEKICRGESGTLQFDIIGLQGTRRHMETHAAPLRSSDGTISQVALTRDITERKERERKLERTLDLLEKTERIADVGGWEIDVDTQDVFWTDHIFDLLEVSDDEEPPLDEALDMYHEEDQPIVEDAVENALDTGDSFDVEVRLLTTSGETRWLRLQGAPETVDDDVVSFRGAAQDVTEHKQREQRLEELVDHLETSNERLEQFAYAASHDLQEPLRMVSSYLQLIEQRYAEELDEDGEEFIEFAVDGADRMRDMIDGLLKYSRVDTRGNPFEPVDLDAIFADVREDFQLTIEENGAEITADSLPHVDGDAGQLRQMFQNLLDNAIEYSDEPPRIHVSAERGEDEWVISVSDEGIGIDSDDADRVFEVFESLHTPDDHSGTGIGLALCERIVERHGGDIWVDSEPGEGATFSFTLPAEGEHSE